MMTIKYCYSTKVTIYYFSEDVKHCFTEKSSGKLEEIAEHCCDVLVAHNFNSAIVTDEKTGEILIEIQRPTGTY